MIEGEFSPMLNIKIHELWLYWRTTTTEFVWMYNIIVSIDVYNRKVRQARY